MINDHKITRLSEEQANALREDCNSRDMHVPLGQHSEDELNNNEFVFAKVLDSSGFMPPEGSGERTTFFLKAGKLYRQYEIVGLYTLSSGASHAVLKRGKTQRAYR